MQKMVPTIVKFPGLLQFPRCLHFFLKAKRNSPEVSTVYIFKTIEISIV